MAGKKGMKQYPLWFRQEITDKHIIDGITVSRLSTEYSVDERRIKLWCSWQRQYGLPKQMTGKRQGRPPLKENEETLERKVKRLEMENTLLKKLNELLMEEETKQK